MDLLIHKCFLRLLSEENSKKDVMGLTMRLFLPFHIYLHTQVVAHKMKDPAEHVFSI